MKTRYMKPFAIFACLLAFMLMPAAGLSQPVANANDTLPDSTRQMRMYPMDCSYRLGSAFFERHNISIGAGFQIGGTAPLPMPRSIRKIDNYNPLLCLFLELQMRRYLDNDGRWSASLGVRFEQKGMKTDATVKGYHMEMTADDGGFMEGDWTGHVKTHVRNSYLTFPLLVYYRISPRWSVNAGPYVSLLLDGDFDGEAYDGYLRHHDPTGEKAYVTHATYDFSDDLRQWSWGLQAGASYVLSYKLQATAQLTWGFNNIFPKDYSSVTFPLYPIYARIGVNYNLW